MKQVLFSLLVLVSFSLNAQTNPIPVKTEGDLKKEAMIEKAKTQAITEVAVERTNAKMTFEKQSEAKRLHSLWGGKWKAIGEQIGVSREIEACINQKGKQKLLMINSKEIKQDLIEN